MISRWSLRLRAILASAGVTAGLVVAVASARAQTSPGADTERRSQARELYDEGQEHYRRGLYEQAIARYKQAYALVPAPELLFNIAQAYRLEGGHCADALHFYQEFRDADPAAAERANVADAIADMERCSAVESARPSPSIQPTAPLHPVESVPSGTSPNALDRPHPSRWPVWVLGGTGLALAATGTTLLVWSQRDYDSIKGTGCAPWCDPHQLDGPRTRLTAGYVLLGAAAAAEAGALIWWITRRNASGRAWVTPTMAGFVAGARF
jgi:tetratricopeptide (TPR) repeat protein